MTTRWLFVLLAALVFCQTAALAAGYEISYDPKTGEYTHYWFDPTGPPNPINMIYSFFLPITSVIGASMFAFIMWAAFVASLWLYTQNISSSVVVGITVGAIMSMFSLINAPELQIIMILFMVFASGGLITKVLLGKP